MNTLNRNNSVDNLVKAALIAALYIAATALIAPVSFGPIQFRISEVLNLLAFFNPLYISAVSLGCFIANILFSPYGLVDALVGTLHTLVSLILIWKTRNLLRASLWPALMSFIVALGIAYASGTMAGFIPLYLYIALSELIIVTVIGVPLMLLLKNSGFIDAYIIDPGHKKPVKG